MLEKLPLGRPEIVVENGKQTTVAHSLKLKSAHIDDRLLPLLPTAMDAEQMRQLLAEHFREHLPNFEFKLSECHIRQVYYHPEKQCGVNYRLVFDNGNGTVFHEWLYGLMIPQGSATGRFERAAKRVKTSRVVQPFLQDFPPVSQLDDLQMILWLFPHDPKMKRMPDAVDPDFMKSQINEHAALLLDLPEAEARNWRCDEFSFDRIKHMPGKRCVLRYRCLFESESGEKRPLTFFHKMYSDSHSRLYFQLLDAAYEQLTHRSGAVEIPRPLRYLEGYNTFWQVDWGGTSLVDIFRNYDRKALFPKLAGILANFHKQEIPELPEGPTIEKMLNIATEDATVLTHYLPEYNNLTATILYYLNNSGVKWTGADIPKTPTHGACRLEQMLIRDTGEIALVDFDAFANADPLSDVAEFMISLQMLGFSSNIPHDELRDAANIFFDSYAARVPWDCPKNRLAWYALTFLITKILSPVKHYDVTAIREMRKEVVDVARRWLGHLKM